MAASVANASTTAPTRTRRFCRIAALKSSHLTLAQFQQLVFQSLVDTCRHNKMQINDLKMAYGQRAGRIPFLVGRIRISRGLQIAKTEGSRHPGNSERPGPAGVDPLGYSEKSNPGLAGCRIRRWLPSARTAYGAAVAGCPHSNTDSPDTRPRRRGPPSKEPCR